MALEEQKCIACEGMTEPLSPDDTRKMMQQIPEWEITDKQIERTFKFPDFARAMAFANKIAQVAEEQNHHPDLHISWGEVKVELTTHKVGGLSTNDFIMAAKINRLIEEPKESPAI